MGGMEEILRQGRTGRRRPEPESVEEEIAIPFLTAARGGKVTIRLGDRELDWKVPAGIADGEKRRFAGQGPGGGDLYLVAKVEPHPYFRREGKDVLLAVPVPVTLAEASLGTQVDVPTIDGTKLGVKIPPGTSSGKRIRIKGKGIDGGDEYFEVQVVVPEVKDERGRQLVEELDRLYPQDPRAKLPWT
jgi:DnaJ-class molecular chaperone